MGKVIKMQKDKMKNLIDKQDKPKRPDTLGMPVEKIDWERYNGYQIKHYAKIDESIKGKPQAQVYTPIKNFEFFLDNTGMMKLPVIVTIDPESKNPVDYVTIHGIRFVHFVEHSKEGTEKEDKAK